MPELNNNQDETAAADKAAGEYQTRSDDVLSKLKAAREEVSAICKGKSWQMRVPVDQSDSDAVICAGIDAAKNEIARLRRSVKEIEQVRDREIAINNDLLAKKDAMRGEIARLREIVDKMYKTKDGSPIVRGMKVFYPHRGVIHEMTTRTWGNKRGDVSFVAGDSRYNLRPSECYSTLAAAEAASNPTTSGEAE